MWCVRAYGCLVLILGVVLTITTVSSQQYTMYEYSFLDIPTPSFSDASITVGDTPISLPYGCPWLLLCICRDESDYTNGTYKLMVNCTKSELAEVPEFIPNETTVLTLDGNSIKEIKPGAFKNLKELKYLDLSNNLIYKLDNNTFKGLDNLLTLELSGNMIHYDEQSLPYSVFEPLRKLERLNLHQKIDNVNKSVEYYPTEALSKLNSLKQLLIDGIEPKNISLAFCSMNNLLTLDLSSVYGRCKLNKIVKDMFKNINSVYDLKISNCSLSFVEKGSFEELEKLTNLDLSYNEKLHFKSLANISFGLQNKTMREIRLVKIHETFGDCTRIVKDHLLYFKNVSVKNLYLDFNRLAYVSKKAVAYIPRSLQKLSVTNNMLLAGEYIRKMFEESVFANLKFLTMADQRMNYDAVKFFDNKTRHMLSTMHNTYSANANGFGKVIEHGNYGTDNRSMTQDQSLDDDQYHFCDNCRAPGVSYETILYIPPGLKDLDLSGLQISNELRNICFCENNTLLRMNLERNVFYSWQGPITGLSNLLSLNLAWNSCDNLSEDVFDNFTSLKQLNLTRNFIERFLRNDEEGRIFRNLKNLFSLVLIDNKIRSIPPKLFQGLESLAVLDLSFNFLTQIDLVFNKRPLQFLDLHNNLLKTIGPGIIQKFEKDRNKQLPYRYLDLRNNSLSCACAELEFIRWISLTKVTLRGIEEYTCRYMNGKKIERLSSADEIYSRLAKDCADYTWVIVGACFGILLFLIIAFGGLIHRYRWDLRYVYYTIKLKMKGNKRITNREDETEFKYDAFISYAHGNSLFIMHTLIPELETKRHLKLLVHGRDFMAGEYVFDNIMQAIKTSRKTLILMSKPFLQSEWCIFEMNMARLESIKTGRNAVCLAMLERVSYLGLPLEIIDIIRQQTYLEMAIDAEITDDYWDRVRDTLTE